MLLAAIFVCGATEILAEGPLYDPLDASPLGWQMIESDSAAVLRSHWLDANGGVDGRGCEALTIVSGNGTKILIEYRLEPSRDIDDVRATLAVQSLREGPELWLRIRYPRIFDKATRQAAVAYVRGEQHAGRGAWEVLGVGLSESERRNRERGLRSRFGGDADLRDAYVEAIVVNAYCGSGTATIRLDNLRVDGLLDANPNPAEASFAAPFAPQGDLAVERQETTEPRQGNPGTGPSDPRNVGSNRPQSDRHSTLFPHGKVLRIIEHNGEPLSYLRMLGMDGVLLGKLPTAELLREAIQENMLVYAPVPTTTTPELEPFLAPIAGWYLGTSVDDSQMDFVAKTSRRLLSLPTLWRRPTMIAPAESWDRYSRLASALVYDLPLSVRGLGGPEEIALLRDQVSRSLGNSPCAVALMTEPPSRLVTQLNSLGRSLGAGEVGDYGWREMYLQAARALTLSPGMIIYRSATPLTGGTLHDARRAETISLVNRWLGIVAPLIASAPRGEGLAVNSPSATATRLGNQGISLIVAVVPSDITLAPEQRQQLTLQLGNSRHRFAWRITTTAVEQLQIERPGGEPTIVLPSPDCVEWIVTSDSPNTGSQLIQRLAGESEVICQLRFSLATQALMRTRDDWRASVGGGILPRTAVPSGLLRGAAESLARVQPASASRNSSQAMRYAIAGDRFSSLAEEALRSRLLPPGVSETGSLPLLAPGGVVLQLAWLPSLEGGRWTGRLLTGGALDQSEELQDSGWTYENRLEAVAESRVGIAPGVGENGTGALRIEAVGRGLNSLPGGYAGTIVRVRSAPITFPVGSWVRIESRVKTLGFGGPNQGLLIYDTDAGSELGSLVRNQPQWTTIRQYRLITSDRPFRVVFEGIGAGEALVDWVDVAMWAPPAEEPRFRPIADLPLSGTAR